MSLVTYNLPGGYTMPMPASIISVDSTATVFELSCPTTATECGDTVETLTVGPWAQISPSVTTGEFGLQAVLLVEVGTDTATTDGVMVTESAHCSISGSLIHACTNVQIESGTTITSTETYSSDSAPYTLAPVTLSVTAGAELLPGTASSTGAVTTTGTSSGHATTPATDSGSKTTSGSTATTSPKASSTGSATNSANDNSKGLKLSLIGVVGILAAAVLL